MIKNIIYHDLIKAQQSLNSVVDLNPNYVTPNKSHQKFLDELTKAYTSRAGKGFGSFDTNEDSYPMPRLLRDYLANNDFYHLTERMMNILKEKISLQSLATGGKVFIAHYEEQDRSYILTAILSERIAFLAKDWDMDENQILDIEHLKFAGRIDLTSWLAEGDRYISFLKGQGDVAVYFKHFLGCNDILIAKTETKKLISFLEEFAQEKDFDLEKKSVFFERAQTYLRDISNSNTPFELEVFANHVYPEDPQSFKNKLGNADNGVADGFIPDKRSLNALSTFTGKTKHWRLSFDREAIANGDITIENGKIIITHPTIDLLKAFE